jgi:uncharacterized protein
MTHHDARALIIFIRNAQLGKVKTRLAASIGDETALAVYQKLLEHTRNTASEATCDRYVYYSDHINPEDAWGAGLFKKRVQNGTDLGQRMSNAFEQVLNQSGAQKALIIGSDCPELTPTMIDSAYTALDTHDVVIGPALDGGYYLLGMKQCHPSLFTDMQWSTETVASETIKRAEVAGLSVAQLVTLRDVDELADLVEVGWW